ncbi:MAG: hypothetical protein ACI9VR_002570 [Cognaticolwellia sp.]|jgi:hypothetical protein
MLKAKLLSHSYTLSTRIGRAALALSNKAGRQNILYGTAHVVRYPLMALRTQMDMGPVRHALSQIVVSGEMVVFPPFGRLPGSPQKPESA